MTNSFILYAMKVFLLFLILITTSEGSQEKQVAASSEDRLDRMEKRLEEISRDNAQMKQELQALSQKSQSESSISILGTVVSSKQITINGKKDILVALSEAGGWTNSADPALVTVRREEKIFVVDVNRIVNKKLDFFMLEAGDIVVVKEKKPQEDEKSLSLDNGSAASENISR